MGFYIRKSVSVGPFRFNLSGSGVGVSVGVRGFRVGSGPRGNYVHVGRGGLYYRQTIPPNPATRRLPPNNIPITPAGTHAPLEEIESSAAAQIVDSSSSRLLAEINEKKREFALAPLVAVGTGALSLFIVLGSGWPPWALVVAVVASAGAILVARYRDKLVKTVVILYDFDVEIEEAFRRFVEWADALAGTRKAWHVAASGRVYDPKYHAGASSLVRRNPTSLRTQAPPFMKTNVPVFSVGVGRQTLFFLPDRLLVYDTSGVGAVTYQTLDLTVAQQRFIEEGAAPSDATVVGHTWRYVNKSGGPDRRFNNNDQLPICLYDELYLRTASGLNEIVQISRSGVGEGFAGAVRHLSSILPQG